MNATLIIYCIVFLCLVAAGPERREKILNWTIVLACMLVVWVGLAACVGLLFWTGRRPGSYLPYMVFATSLLFMFDLTVSMVKEARN